MHTFNNVLLTTDLSLNSDAAVPYAIALAQRSKGTIFLFHAFEEETGEALASGVVIGVSAWIMSIRQQHEEKLAKLAKDIEAKSGVRVVHATASGHPANEIVHYAKAIQADVVVIATHGRTGLSHLLLGSIAERVVRLSPAPVLTVRPGEPLPQNGAFHTILVPTDFSSNSAGALPYAIELAKQDNGKILLAHVIEDSMYYSSAAASEGIGPDVEQWIASVTESAEKRLNETAHALKAASGLPVETILSRGRAPEKIGELAKERNADLVVISTHGYTGLSHLVFGSVAERVVRSSPAPVLSIRPQKHT
jgi:nucleotide-binding universal stress UspA family protein